MEPLRDDQLIADLQALRPTPRPRFAAELDERVATDFPRRSRLRLSLPPLSARRVLVPAGGVAVVVIAVATALTVSGPESSESGGGRLSELRPMPGHTEPDVGATAGEGASGTSYEAESQVAGSAAPADSAVGANRGHRAVERSAEVTLAAEPEDVADDASKVFEAVHANNGIVMSSSTQQGAAGEAGATFDLLVPSARLADAMAAFSEIDHVRSRHEATADITAPTVTAAELLEESRARIDSLLGQLEAAESEEEREAIEAELRHERRHASRLAAQLTHLHRRADLSRVSLRIETGGERESSGGGWGIDDALDDAGHVLTVAAAVTLIALAVLGPIALIALLAWLTHRAWVRRERRRVLS